MLVVLPPSETKRDGGIPGSGLDLSSLRFASELVAQRTSVLDALARLGADPERAIRALALGRTQHAELQRNLEVRTSAVLPAIERYTGVLFDALDAESLGADARAFAADHLIIHSALFGLIGAGDPIPAYRLSHNSRLPELSLRRLWRPPISALLAEHHGLVVDLRSEVYAQLGPAPETGASVYVRVVSESSDGTTRALSHFNKAGKGRFTRALLEAGVVLHSTAEVIDWANSSGFRMRNGDDGEADLIV